jgi:hypothetical protein
VSPTKKPQDHKRKDAAALLQAEASKIPGLQETEGRKLTFEVEGGPPITVTTRSVLKWKGSVQGFLREGDYLAAFCGMVSPEDAAILRAADPDIESLMTALYAPADDGAGEASPGESRAS